jgi:hypothetical protein
MDELLQKLLEAEVLSVDTKKELEGAFKTQLDEAIAAARDEAAADVRAELTEQWVRERDTLIEAIDSKVGEYLETEIDELKEDIDRFRDLEAEYAEKLVETKSAMKDELRSDLKDLVEKIDAFLEIRLAAEIEELREDIDEVRKNEFGRKIFEAFAKEFTMNYADEDSAEATLRETAERLSDVEKALEESERKRTELERSIKLDEVLAPLSGRQREVMEAILRNVDTENLEEGYKTFIGRVLRETSGDTASSEKEDKVLAEGEKKSEKKDSKKLSEGVSVTGDSENSVVEESDKSMEDAAAARRAYLQKLAGIK